MALSAFGSNFSEHQKLNLSDFHPSCKQKDPLHFQMLLWTVWYQSNQEIKRIWIACTFLHVTQWPWRCPDVSFQTGWLYEYSFLWPEVSCLQSPRNSHPDFLQISLAIQLFGFCFFFSSYLVLAVSLDRTAEQPNSSSGFHTLLPLAQSCKEYCNSNQYLPFFYLLFVVSSLLLFSIMSSSSPSLELYSLGSSFFKPFVSLAKRLK